MGQERFADEARQRDDDDFQREDEVGADGGADFFLFDLRRIAVISGFSRVFFAVMRQAVQDFFDAFVAQVGAANHQDQRHGGRQKGAQEKGCGDDNRLVEQRAFAYRPDNRQFAARLDAGELVGIERQIVAKHACGFFGGDFGHRRDVIQQGGDVVQECKESGSHAQLSTGAGVSA